MKILKRLSETRLTSSDVFYLLAKVAIASLLLSSLGLMYGLSAILILNYLVDLTIRNVYNLHSLNYNDKNVFYDQVSNRCQIMCAILIEKSDEDTLRQSFEKKLQKDHLRFRCSMTKVADTYYFKELTQNQLAEQRDNVF
jgi:hypothetical protein